MKKQDLNKKIFWTTKKR